MQAADQKLVDSFQRLTDDAFVAAAYVTLLGRSPDPGGAAAYLARLRAGIPRIQIWSEIAAGDEARRFAERAGGAQAIRRTPVQSVADLLMLDGVDFVRQAYRQVLGRDADPSGLRDYANRLASGTPKQEVVADLRSDPEGQAYAAYAAPLPGLDELVRQVQLGATAVRAISSLQDLLSLQGESFVRAAYLALFKREPDPQGMATYLDVLHSGFSKMHVLKALYGAPEAREKAAKLPGLKLAIEDYDKAQLSSWKGWYYRAVMGAPSDFPVDRELRSLVYRLLETKR